MGDYTIRISTSLIEQLARDDEKQVKRRTRKPKPKKVVEQPEEPQDNGRELPTEPKSSPAPVLPFAPPMYLPVTPAPAPPPPVIQEVEAIRAVVAESEKVLEKLQKEATMREELTKRAQELHDKEFKLPYQNPRPVHRLEGRLCRVLQEQRAGPAQVRRGGQEVRGLRSHGEAGRCRHGSCSVVAIGEGLWVGGSERGVVHTILLLSGLIDRIICLDFW